MPPPPPYAAQSPAPPAGAAPPGFPPTIPQAGPQPPYGPSPYYPPYGYYPPYYSYPYAPPQPPRPLEPRQLRTVQGLDTAVFAAYVLGASFMWSALVGGIAAAAMLPALSGAPRLGATELGWLSGVMVARVIVWVMYVLAGILLLATFARFHEGRLEFGTQHERRYREFQAAGALFAILVGGSGILAFILSNNPSGPASASSLGTLQDSIRLSALIWGVSTAAAGFALSSAFAQLLKPFLPADRLRALRVFPVVFLFVPLLHAALAISFTELAAIDTGGWTAEPLRGAAEAGGIAGLASALPLLHVVRALRAAHDRVVSGEVKSELSKRAA